MMRQLEVGVLYTGLGWYCCQVFLALYQHDPTYLAYLLVYVLTAGVIHQSDVISTSQSHEYRIASPGIPYCLLFPLSLIVVNVDDAKFLTILIPLTLLLYTSHCKHTTSRTILICLLLLMVVGHVILFRSTDIGLTLMLCVGYLVMTDIIPVCFNMSFSFGELSIVCQIYVFFMYCVIKASCIEQVATVRGKVTAIIFLTTSVLIIQIGLLKKMQASTVQAITSIITTVILIALAVLYWFISLGEIKLLAIELFRSNLSAVLLLWWICCTVISILIVYYYGNRKNTIHNLTLVDPETHYNPTYEAKQMGETHTQHTGRHIFNGSPSKSENNGSDVHDVYSKTAGHKQGQIPMFVRKYFHVVILAIFVPGMLFHPTLLYVASCAALALFLLIEAVRVYDINPFSGYLNEYLLVFLDRQDQGDLILTPIYLLLGCSLPLWFITPKRGHTCTLVHYSGLLSVGIGDAAASVIGRKFGYHKWPDSKKTVEGTIAAFFSQVLGVIILRYANVPDATIDVQTLLVLLLVSCLEAVTQHIDNLVVPVYAIMLFLSRDLL